MGRCFLRSVLSVLHLYFSIALPFFLIASSSVGVEARPARRARSIHTRQSTDGPCAGFFDSEFDLFLAKDAYDCLLSVPFNQTVALQFLQYYSDTLQLQSTQGYLQTPPADYQQPTVDLLGGLEKIKSQVQAGNFQREYDFEYAVQQLVLASHDAHLQLAYGILDIFAFGSPYGLVSVSRDGIELPKAYIPDDLIEAEVDDGDWIPSAVVEINGQETTRFLEAFAEKHVLGYLEANADWNNLMSSAASDIQGILSAFEGNSIFYPGEKITFTFENGTVTGELPWLATFGLFTDPADAPLITTGQELYDWFVLGVDSTPNDQFSNDAAFASAAPTATDAFAPDESGFGEPTDDTPDESDSTDEPAATPTSALEATPTPWPDFAYPADPIVGQRDLGDANGGILTGYILNDKITAVLSIPSFFQNGENAASFTSTVEEFIKRAKAAGCTRVIIDVQRNQGGSDVLATDTFKQFFPTVSPFDGSRLRAVKTVDALGNTFTTYYNTHLPEQMDPPYEVLSANAFVATNYLNANTGQNFTSWPEFFGPNPHDGDLFTTTQRNNLSSVVFTEASADIVVFGTNNRTTNSTNNSPPFPANDVIILSDAFCSSACATFVEQMKSEGGARTIVAGGRPELGPMQTVGGTRGSQGYDSFSLDNDIDVATEFNKSVAAELPKDRDNVDFILTYAGFNLKDAIRKDSNTPLQFTYEAADCRIFYTKWTVYNYINLWNYVIDALYRNPSLCVAGSTNVKTAPSKTSSTPTSQTPTPSTVGALIAGGLHRNRKRSLHSTTPIRQKRSPMHNLRRRSPLRSTYQVSDPAALHTSQSNRPFDLEVCQRCTGTDICFQSPVCRRGAIVTVPTCATRCSVPARIGCRDPRFPVCHMQGKGGFCISVPASQAVQDCAGSKTGPAPGARTKAANPAVRGLGYDYGTGRPGQRGGGR